MTRKGGTLIQSQCNHPLPLTNVFDAASSTSIEFYEYESSARTEILPPPPPPTGGFVQSYCPAHTHELYKHIEWFPYKLKYSTVSGVINIFI